MTDIVDKYVKMSKEDKEKLFAEWTKPVPKPSNDK